MPIYPRHYLYCMYLYIYEYTCCSWWWILLDYLVLTPWALLKTVQIYFPSCYYALLCILLCIVCMCKWFQTLSSWKPHFWSALSLLAVPVCCTHFFDVDTRCSSRELCIIHRFCHLLYLSFCIDGSWVLSHQGSWVLSRPGSWVLFPFCPGHRSNCHCFQRQSGFQTPFFTDRGFSVQPMPFFDTGWKRPRE